MNRSKEQVVSLVRQNLPNQLLSQQIWIAYYFKKNNDNTFTKPPVKGYSVTSQEPGYTFQDVIKDGYPGIKLNASHTLIAFDIDDKKAKLGQREFSLDSLSNTFSEFVRKKNTYTEFSPSKCGLRLLFQVSKEDKAKLPGRASLIKEHCIGGEFYANSGYVTITGDKLLGSEIQTTTYDEVMQWIKLKNDDKPAPLPAMPKKLGNVPTIQHIANALECCKLDQSRAVQRAYKAVVNEEYGHYDFWMRIMAACHHYTTVTTNTEREVLSLVLDWSRTDEESYQDDDDVITHWESLTSHRPDKVTFSTLFKFAKLIRFNWPKEVYDKKTNQPTGKPMINEIDNFLYLLDYYDINFYIEPYSNSIHVAGDEKTINQYFKDKSSTSFFGKVGPFTVEAITMKLWHLAQNNHYDNATYSTIGPLTRAAITQKISEFNILSAWLSTPYEDLPEGLLEPNTDPTKSNIDYLMSCLRFNKQQNIDLTRQFLDAFFFGIVMPVYNPKRLWPEHNFMLILTGPENCRKSSFLASLVPRQLAKYLITNSVETLNSDKSLRDLKIQLTSSALMIVDEFELFFTKKNDSLFKNLVTCSEVDYIPIYSKATTKVSRTAALAGTTNKRRLPLEQNSSRRVAIIEVDFIDTDKLSKINWHTFYSSYVKRGKKLLAQNQYPWKLDQDTILLQYEENERFRSSSDLEYLLKELFDFDAPFQGLNAITSVQTGKDPLYSRNDIAGIIKQRYPSQPIKLSALVNTLEQLCGKYTKTTRQTNKLPICKGTISNGVVKQGQWTKYYMPPRIIDFERKQKD